VVTNANGCTVATPDDMSLYEEVVSKGKFTTRDINFDIGKSVIRPESFTTINRIASFMKEPPDILFRIDGIRAVMDPLISIRSYLKIGLRQYEMH
jgi:outer membrane protein OmpA-like peptidoglycan-associated protein